MGFVSDALFYGRQLRLLTVIDLCTRMFGYLRGVGQNLHSSEVAEILNIIVLRRPLPYLLKTDNGYEYAADLRSVIPDYEWIIFWGEGHCY